MGILRGSTKKCDMCKKPGDRSTMFNVRTKGGNLLVCRGCKKDLEDLK